MVELLKEYIPQVKQIIIDNNSNDGTNDWLLEMKSFGKIDEVIINSELKVVGNH